MATKNPTRAAKPTRNIFDAFNSSATGHQRADNRLSGSTSWRDSRSAKLASQFRSGLGGGRRVQDTVGAGSADFGVDGRAANGSWLPGAKGLRGAGQLSLWDSFAGGGAGAGARRAQAKDENVAVGQSGVRVQVGGRSDLRVCKIGGGGERTAESKEVVQGSDELERRVCGVSEGRGQMSCTPPPPAPPRTSQESYEDALLASSYAIGESPATTPRIANDTDATDSTNLNSDMPPNNPSTHADTSLPSHDQSQLPQPQPITEKQIFRNLTIYINGSTAPLISDHKLKRLLVEHGANISISLGRRSVTHVILGQANNNNNSSGSSDHRNASGSVGKSGSNRLIGAGGGLASGKMHKEITQIRNCGGNAGVKFVSAEWAVACIRAGKRLCESRFESLRLAPKGVGNIADMFSK